MSITLNSVITNLNSYIGDASEDRITNTERFQYLTEATVWLQEELGNEHMNVTKDINYYDGIHKYKITGVAPDLLVGADLRRSESLHREAMSRKSPKEIAEEIGQQASESAWAIERTDGDSFLMINHRSEYRKIQIDTFESLTSSKGTWVVASDAENITIDLNEFTEGRASLNFDVDVSDSADNKAVVYIPRDSADNLSSIEDIGAGFIGVYLPDVTYISSVTVVWGSDEDVTPSTKTNYWSKTVTTDFSGSAFVAGWNKLKLDWPTSTRTGTPDSTEIFYYEVAINYSASQGDDTDFRIDNFFFSRPEKLVLHYVSYLVGESNVGADLTSFSATTDIPFFSGRYDQYRYVVARWAAALIYYSLRLGDQADREELKAMQALQRYRLNFESSKTREEKSFKVKGISLSRRGGRGGMRRARTNNN